MSGSRRFNPLLVKFVSIVLTLLLLCIPLNLVQGLIGERNTLRSNAIERVAGNVGHAQQLGAVMLTVPLTRSWTEDGKTSTDTTLHHLLAQTVHIDGNVTSSTRHSGIYSVPTFAARLKIDGTIATAAWRDLLAPEPGIVKRLGPITLMLALTDPTGIRVLDGVRVDGKTYAVAPIPGSILKGVGFELAPAGAALPDEIGFAFDLQISGTERLQFLPFAASTQVDLHSTWPSPSFSGAYGPLAATQVSAQGFNAQWRVLQLNRDFPQEWAGDKVSAGQLAESAFGVDFYQPVDTYQCNYRAVHYAFLLIGLSFMILFLLEHLFGLALHPVQYAMTGAALATFYLVLLAVSEHLAFGWAYGLASAALVGLLGIYYSGVAGSVRTGTVAGLITGLCYALLYLLILSEENALLFGALLLFATLAAIMIATRKVDWYRLGTPR